MPCITELHSLFYVNNVKVIPAPQPPSAVPASGAHNIYELLTPVAHLIMGDGSVSRHGLILCTDSYSLPDRLMNVLIIRYELVCTLHKKSPRGGTPTGAAALGKSIPYLYLF